MTVLLFSSIVVANLFCAWTDKKSKLVFAISFVFLFVLFIGYGNVGYQTHHDLSIYIDVYNNSDETRSMEIGYHLLMLVGRFFDLDFFTFKAVVTVLSFGLIIYSVLLYTRNFHLFLAMYAMFSLINDTERFRNFIAIAIVFYAVTNWLFIEKKHNKIIYIFLILIASTFHTSMLFYLILLIVGNRQNVKVVNLVLMFTTVACLILFMNDNKIPFTQYIIDHVNNAKLIRYLKNSGTNFGFLMPVVLHSYKFLLVYITRRIVLSGRITQIPSEKDMIFINSAYTVNKILFTVFPLAMLQLIFSRLFYGFLIIDYVYFSIIFTYIKTDTKVKALYLTAVSLVPLMWTFVEFFIRLRPDHVFIPFFTKNIFIP